MAPDRLASGLADLRRTEAIIVRLRWLGIASRLLIVQRAELTATPRVVYGIYAACVLYTRRARATRRSASC